MQHNARDRAPAVVKALGMEGIHRILDLGGGSGIYSIAFAKASSEAKCEILDLAEVVPLTCEYVAKAGLSSQIVVRAGDMLHDDLGSGYDLIMLNAICHMFSEKQNMELFRRARLALAPRGRMAVQDFILQPDKTQPTHAALFSVNMLVGTDGGACYSEPEYIDWMKEAGFNGVRRIHMPGPSDLIVGQVA
jgi:cyclopropane fatty-acyl-phospholipid synthase-like methyltransferase